MSRLNVGIGEFHISSNSEDEIKTYALGSCVAMIVWDKIRCVGGMIHFALPESNVNLAKAQKLPGYFVDTGLPVFFQEFKKMGAQRGSTWIKLVGGASILDENNTFDIGKRNVLSIRKHLWAMGLGVIKEDIGGTISRTVSLMVKTGEIVISNSGNQWNL